MTGLLEDDEKYSTEDKQEKRRIINFLSVSVKSANNLAIVFAVHPLPIVQLASMWCVAGDKTSGDESLHCPPPT